jgi:hypothetical protein
MAKGFLRFMRGNTIALLALFIALGGTTYAATALPKNSVGTKQLKKNAVTSVKIKNSNVTNGKIANNAVTGGKVKDDSLTGADLLESSLGQVPSAASATTAATATNALSLGGVAAAGYTKNDCSSTTGQIKGFARVLASGTFSSTFTTTGVTGYSCSGGTVEARRVATGHYRVRFNGTSLSQGIGTSQAPGTSFNFDFVVMGQVAGTPPEFDVWVIHYDGNAADQEFNVLAFG